MKKLLVGILALSSVSAFAQNHMVQLSGYEGDRQDRSLDLYNSNGGSNHSTTSNIALNYAFAINPTWQVGGLFKKYQNEGAGSAKDKSNRYGVFGIWNLNNRLTDTNYLGLKYTMGNQEVKNSAGAKTNDDDTQTLSVEFGHRFLLGKLWDMSYTWSPSAELGVSRVDPDSGSTSSTTEFALNVLKVDVLF